MKTHKLFLFFHVLLLFSLVPESRSQETVGGSAVNNGSQPFSYTLLRSKEMTSADEHYRRPDVVSIDNMMYLAFANQFKFVLARVGEDLDYSIIGDLAKPPDEFGTDVRLATDGSDLWCAMETIPVRKRPECGSNFLNSSKYSIGKNDIKRLLDYPHITSGCPTTPQFIQSFIRSPMVPHDAKAVDDPTPFFFNDHYYIMVRGWINKKTQYIYMMDKNFNIKETIELDLGAFIPRGYLSQNVLINIDGQIYLIAGVKTGPPMGINYSQIKAFPLSRDLKRVNGNVIDLIPTNDQYFTRVTAAVYYKGKLFFNFIKTTKSRRESEGYIAVMNVKNGFKNEDYILFQEQSAFDNHSSFTIVNDKIYIFYQTPQQTVMAKVFALINKES